MADRLLDLKEEKHPKPYSIQWFKKEEEVPVKTRCLLSFSIGKYYKDDVWFNVAMDVAQLLLGHPWLYDHDVLYRGKANNYMFLKDNINVMLHPRQTFPMKGVPQFFRNQATSLKL